MKPNDEVICIDNRSNGSSYIMMDVALTIGKYYIVQNPVGTETIRVINDESIFKDYRKNRFVTKEEWLQRQRQRQLNKLGI